MATELRPPAAGAVGVGAAGAGAREARAVGAGPVGVGAAGLRDGFGIGTVPSWNAAVERATAAASCDAVIGIDDLGRIVSWNPPAERLFGWSASEAAGRMMAQTIIAERHRAAYDAAVGRMIHDRRPTVDNGMVEVTAVRRDGQEMPVELAMAGAVVQGRRWFRAVIRDTTERKALERELRQRALADPLTGLPNRTLLFDRLAQASSRLDRAGGSIAVLFVDLDRFKVVNDGLGHEAGDRVLTVVGQRIESVLRGSDTVARYGGDEFVVLCEEVASPQVASLLAERIAEAIRQPIPLVERAVVVTASIGIALVDRSDGNGDDLLRDADAAMYQSKQAGGDGHSMFASSRHRRGAGRLDIEIDLRAAIDREELRLVYQPTIDLTTGRVTGAEALLRWDHPERGTVSPLDFIPLAEETGLIVPVGAWVLDNACRQLASWKASLGALAPAAVSVNLSGRQLAGGGLADLVARVLAKHGLDPSSLCLEITESVLMDDSARTTGGLDDLRRLGVQLSVDDFGTGYSSLLYLRRLPVGELKIDRIFTAGLGRNPEDTAIVEGVIALGHALRLRVVAEGVETADQAESLRHLCADVGQGYFWSRPVGPDQLAALLRRCDGTPGAVVADDHLTLGPNPDRLTEGGTEVYTGVHTEVERRASYRVLLIDDARPERELLRIWLDESHRFVVAGEADNGRQGVEMAAELLPDVVVLDMAMPGMSGMEAIRQVVSVSPRSKVVVVSGFLSTGLAQAMVDQGAAACLDKGIGPARLIELVLDGVEARATPQLMSPQPGRG